LSKEGAVNGPWHFHSLAILNSNHRISDFKRVERDISDSRILYSVSDSRWILAELDNNQIANRIKYYFMGCDQNCKAEKMNEKLTNKQTKMPESKNKRI